MTTDPRLIALAERAASTLDTSPAAPDDGPTLTVVLQGKLRGAVHLFVPEHAGEDALSGFSRALLSEAAGAGLESREVWRGRSRGPHRGERVGAVVLELAAADQPPVHIGQSIAEVQELTEKSVMAIGDEMRSIWELARSQADGLKRIAEQFSSAGDGQSVHGNVATTIEQLAAQMRAFGQEILDRTHRQARDIEQARAWTNDIVKFGQAISGIASNARLLTFNARLESARIGEAGRGFAVIAGSIQELATQVRQTNNAVAQLAQNLATALPRLNADALSTSQAAEVSVAQIEAQLLEVQSHLNGMRTDSFQALSSSSSAAQELQGRADQVITHLQFQDRASRLLTDARAQAQAMLAVAGVEDGPAQAPAAGADAGAVLVF